MHPFCHVQVFILINLGLWNILCSYKLSCYLCGQGDVLSVETFLGDVGLRNWTKYKHDFRVEFVNAPGILVDFHWAALIDKPGATANATDIVQIGAQDLFKRWLRTPNQDLPHLIIFSKSKHASCSYNISNLTSSNLWRLTTGSFQLGKWPWKKAFQLPYP